jgi:Protein of unknown function (DUF3300)
MNCARETAILCVALLIGPQSALPFQQPQPAAGDQGQPQNLLNPGQLDSLVAPLALYPDPILSQVLVASTYPLEIVEAARWMQANQTLQGKALTDAAAQQPWDASVQAMVAFPDLLSRLNQNLSWTTDLGNAFLAQQANVMDAIQRMRQKASESGALQSTSQQTVTTSTQGNQTFIEIQPANPQVVYLPSYDPAAIWGAPAYYPYPPVSTGAVIAAGAISFGAGIAMGAFWGGGWGGWGGWGWHPGWGHSNVVINNNFINNNHFTRTNVANGNNWVHNPAHRGGVPYSNSNVGKRFGTGGNTIARPNASQTQQRFNQMEQRPGAGQGAASRLGPGNRGEPGRGVAPAQGGANRMGGFGSHGSGGRRTGGGRRR